MSVFSPRIENIANKLEDNQCALVTSDISITYLTGFRHSEGYVFITKDNSYFLMISDTLRLYRILLNIWISLCLTMPLNL